MKYKVLKEFLTEKNPRWREPGEEFYASTKSKKIIALLEKCVYTAYYSHKTHRLYTNGYAVNQFPCNIWFRTREDVVESIKAHEKEWLVYLGVEE